MHTTLHAFCFDLLQGLGGARIGDHLGIEPGRLKHAREHQGGNVIGLVARGHDAHRRRRPVHHVLRLRRDLVRRFAFHRSAVFQVFDQSADGVEDEALALLFQRARMAVLLGERERRNHHLVIEREQAFLVGEVFGQVLGLVLVHGEQALVEARRRREHRLDAEDHVEVAELGHVAAHHRDAHGERGREQQADRPPQPGPEERRQDDGDRREPGAAAVEPAARRR